MAPMLVGAAWMLRVIHKAERPTGKCPHCGAGLWRHLRLVAATGNCVRCGQRVIALAAPEPPGAGVALIPIAEVLSSGRAVGRALWRRLGAGAALCALILIVCAILAAGGRRERFQAKMERQFGGVNAVLIDTGLAGVVVLAASCAFYGGLLWAVRGLSRSPGLNCPHCGEPVSRSGLAIATKCCTKCRAAHRRRPGRAARVAAGAQVTAP
jgi:hypothetical protein